MQQINTERVLDWTRLDEEGDQLGNVQEIEIWHEQMIYVQPRICPEE